MSLVCYIWPDRIYLWCIWRDDHRPVLARVPVTRILTLQVLPYCPIRLASPVCSPEPWYFGLSGGGVQAELQAETPLWLGHTVVSQSHHTLVHEVSMLLPRGEVATCILGNSWTGTRVHAPWPQGLRSICLLASLDQLEAVVAFSSGYLLWP